MLLFFFTCKWNNEFFHGNLFCKNIFLSLNFSVSPCSKYIISTTPKLSNSIFVFQVSMSIKYHSNKMKHLISAEYFLIYEYDQDCRLSFFLSIAGSPSLAKGFQKIQKNGEHFFIPRTIYFDILPILSSLIMFTSWPSNKFILGTTKQNILPINF